MRSVLLRNLLLVGILAACAIQPLQSIADEGPLRKDQPTGITVEEIIKRFTEKEKEFKTERDTYGYRQTVKAEVLDGDTVTGEYRQVFDVSFDDKGNKIKYVVFSPQPTATNMTKEDFADIEDRLPFTLSTDELPEYNLLYVGMQDEDELHCFVFDIAPKQFEKNKRYFQGRIWVDDKDFQIVKNYGKSVPDIHLNRKGKGQENLFPKFTTWREQIDGKYWFPTYSFADDVLHFVQGGDQHVRESVRYTNYKKFGSKSTITYEGKEIGNAPKGQTDSDDKPTPQEKPKQ
jgi:hypothetical protein